MLSFCAANVQTGSFTCENSATWANVGGLPTCTKKFVFDVPYTSAPNVILTLTDWDIQNSKNLQIVTNVTEVSKTGFTATAAFWGKTVVNKVIVSWLSTDAVSWSNTDA
uniref:H-type lectin domain-containing protein n=1 Tax=Arion vulgaris TaxID=1028688 RepID=A0A0B6Y9P9_9EUPU